MKGHTKSFTVNGVTLRLARCTIPEWEEHREKFEDATSNLEVSEYGLIEQILTLAVADESEADKAAFAKLSDIGDRTKLWDQYKVFAEVDYFLAERYARRLSGLRDARKREYLAAGLTPEETEQALHLTMGNPLSMSSTLLNTDSLPTESTP